MLDIDGPIYVADFGGDGPVMLLVHGLGGSHLNWMSVAPQLAAHHRVYALDLPGFGRSPLAGRRSTIAANVDLLTRAITRLSRDRIVLMGNSMGGLLSIGAAARHPEPRRRPRARRPRGAGSRVASSRPGSIACHGPSSPPRSCPAGARGGSAVPSRRSGPESLVRETMRLVSADPSRIEPTVVDAHIALEAERLAEFALARVLLRGHALAGDHTRPEAKGPPVDPGGGRSDPAPPGRPRSSRPRRLGAQRRVAPSGLGVPRVRGRRTRPDARGAGRVRGGGQRLA